MLFAPTVLHEALHSDEPDGRAEEAAAHLLHNFVSAELLARYPDIADDKTQLSREVLTEQLAIIFNSNTMLASRGELLPGGLSLNSHYEDAPFQQGVPEVVTPGSPLLGDLLAALGQPSGTIPTYSESLLATLDIDEIIDSPASTLSFEGADLLTIGEALTLELDLPSPVTSTTSTSSTVVPSTSTSPTTTTTILTTTGSGPTRDSSLMAMVDDRTTPSDASVGQRKAVLSRTGASTLRWVQFALALLVFGLALLVASQGLRNPSRRLD